MKFEDAQEGFLFVVQNKTAKAADAGWLKLKMTPPLQAVPTRCQDDVSSPHLIHRRPECEKKREGKDLIWSEVEADLSTSEVAGWFCACFARAQKSRSN
jgi:hypothetical protein